MDIKSDRKEITYYDNGKIHCENTYINNKLSGIQKTWYKNSKIMQEAMYENGKRHGLFRQYTPNGYLQYETMYENGKKHGYDKKWHIDDNVLFFQGNYKAGKKDGIQLGYYPNGNIRVESNYKDDLKDGKQILWCNESIKHGKYNEPRCCIDYGKIYEENYKDNKKHGIQKNWFSELRNNKCQDVSCTLHGIQYEETYNNGLIHGVRNVYDKDGTRIFHGNFIYGYKHGLAINHNSRKWYFFDREVTREIFDNIIKTYKEYISFLNFPEKQLHNIIFDYIM